MRGMDVGTTGWLVVYRKENAAASKIKKNEIITISESFFFTSGVAAAVPTLMGDEV